MQFVSDDYFPSERTSSAPIAAAPSVAGPTSVGGSGIPTSMSTASAVGQAALNTVVGAATNAVTGAVGSSPASTPAAASPVPTLASNTSNVSSSSLSNLTESANTTSPWLQYLSDQGGFLLRKPIDAWNSYEPSSVTVVTACLCVGLLLILAVTYWRYRKYFQTLHFLRNPKSLRTSTRNPQGYRSRQSSGGVDGAVTASTHSSEKRERSAMGTGNPPQATARQGSGSGQPSSRTNSRTLST
jgi:hypothetical protein